MFTVKNVRKFTKFLCYKGNLQFDDIMFLSKDILIYSKTIKL